MTRRQFLAAGAALLGAGTSVRAQPRAAHEPRELRLALSSEATSADPHFAAFAPNINLAQHVFDALVHVDAAGRYVPGLATSWRSVDPLTWEIKLRPGVRFHDGSELTVEDVVFSLQRPGKIIDSPGPFTTFSRQIANTRVVDATTLHIATRDPYGGLPGDLSSLFIVSKRAAEQALPADFDAGRAAIGTGPFRLRAFTKGQSVTLDRHEGYWGGKAAWPSVTLVFIPDEKQRSAALLAGQVDAIEGVSPSDVSQLRAQRGLTVVQRTSWRTVFLHLEQFTDRSPWIADSLGRPMETSPLKSRRVRHALSLAINRPALVHSILEGLAEPAAQLVAPGILGYRQSLKPDPFDAPEARRLLAEAGFPSGFTLTMHAPSKRYIHDEQVAATVAQLWSRVGVRTRVETMPVSGYFTRARRGEFSVAMLGYGSLAGDFALRALLGTPDSVRGWGAWNWSKYSNTKLDAAIRESLRSTDASRRQDQAAAAMEIAMQDHAVIPLHHQFASWAMRAGFTYGGRVDEFTLAQHFRAT